MENFLRLALQSPEPFKLLHQMFHLGGVGRKVMVTEIGIVLVEREVLLDNACPLSRCDDTGLGPDGMVRIPDATA